MNIRPINGVTVIGITGHARNGKDELAKALARRLPGCERFAFSDMVAVAERVAPLPAVVLLDQEADPTWSHPMGKRDPKRLQMRGEYERETDPMVWVKAMFGLIDDHAPEYVVLTGVRNDQEATMIQVMGGVLARITRVQADGTYYRATDRDNKHPVESRIASLQVNYDILISEGQHKEVIPMAAEWLLNQIASRPCHERQGKEAAPVRVFGVGQ